METRFHYGSWLILWRPEVMFCVLVFASLYFLVAIGPLNCQYSRAFPKATLKQAAAASAAFVVLYLTMGSPLTIIAQKFLFSGYVLQMLLMTQVLPILILMAVPPEFVSRVYTLKPLHRIFKFACRPVIAPVVYNVMASAFLLPGNLDLALTSNFVHFFEQTGLFVAALFLWCPLSQSASFGSRLSPSGQLLYLVFSANFMMPIAVFLFLSQDPWYHVYRENPAWFGITPLGDQQLAAVLMILGMALIYGLRAIPPFLSYKDTNWYK